MTQRKRGQWWWSFYYSCRHEGLQFYEKDTLSQVLSYDICEVYRTSLLVIVQNSFWQNQSSGDVLCKKGVFKNFPKFTEKHLCQSLFFNNVAGLRPAPVVLDLLSWTLDKEDIDLNTANQNVFSFLSRRNIVLIVLTNWPLTSVASITSPFFKSSCISASTSNFWSWVK